MEEKYGKSNKSDKADKADKTKPKPSKRKKPSYRALFGGDNEELSESAEADYTTSISPVLNTANMSASSDKTKTEKSNKTEKSDIDTKTQATGGFPPIYIISKEAKEKEKTKQRELATRDSAVSIMDILKRKKI
jgi:hypothetical protein